jgi:4-amino-4-deoxy-L-arabinose transferase-like glycosyltransferase
MSVIGLSPAPSRPRHARPAQPEKSTPVIALMLTAAPVGVILLAQAFLSVRLLHASHASGDESLYIYSGHQLIHELWHGGGSPYYEEWLSGAPIIYPVMAAMLDHLGGLALVRFSSCIFMLIATGLLYATTRRLFGYWPAVVAAGLFASLGITHGLGALATFDAMALAIMAFAAYCAVRAQDGDARWLLIIPGILLLANATKYASVLFDPVIIALAAFLLRDYGWRAISKRLASLGLSTLILLTAITLLAGSGYIHGIMFTTLSRPTGAGAVQLFGSNFVSPAQVAEYSWSLIGAVVCLGFLALVMALCTRTPSFSNLAARASDASRHFGNTRKYASREHNISSQA